MICKIQLWNFSTACIHNTIRKKLRKIQEEPLKAEYDTNTEPEIR